MKKTIFILGILFTALPVYATDITWADKTTGGTFSATDANAIKTAVNSKANSSDFDQAVKTTSNTVFNSINLSSGNVAANNIQVAKAWTTGLSYTDDVTAVIHGGNIYVCTSTHTAGSTTEPGVGASWGTVWKFWGADTYQSLMGSDDNYVTDAEKTKLSNLSGTNTGDQTTITGNAGTATVLQTARTIGGVSFNGSANINLPGVNAAGNQNTTGTAAGLTAQYIDWNSSSGGSSIANKPTISGSNTGDQIASGVAFTPNGTIAATTVQAAIQEVRDEAGASGATAINDLTDVDTTGKATGKVLKFDSSGNMVVGDDEIGAAGTGDITGVTAGTGLTGGGDTGAVTVGLSTTTTDAIAANTAKVSFDATSSARLANTSGTNTGDQVAGGVAFTPNGTIAATTVQAAIQEVRDEAAPTASPTFTGTITVPALSGATYTGTSLVSAVQAALTANDNAVDINASTYMLTVLDDADAATARATLGAAAALGTDDNYATDAEKVKLGNLSGTNTGDQTPTSLGLVIGTNVQAFDADLTDLADGSLTGSKVGTGISGTNITTGTVPDAQIASTIARDTEVSSAVSTHAGLTDPHTGYMLESNIGTSANNYVQLNASAQLPAVSGALLTNLPASPDDQTAGEVAFTPNGTIAATTVQAAIQEVRDEASSVDLSAPGPIGATTPSTAAFTTVSADDIIIAPPPAGETGEIGLKEAPANGTNEVILKAPAALAANVTITLPSGTVPASATATCTAGQWWFDTSYWYVCVATNTWQRATLATW